MAASLGGVRLKIDRAEKHLRDFDAQFDAANVITTNVKLVSVEEQPEGRLVSGDITSGELAPNVGIPLGDSVHSLRSSLDHLMCQLAIAAGNPNACEKTQFPIFSDDTSENRKRMKRWIKFVSPEAQTEIEGLQPYKRRPQDPTSDLLWLLSELDNIDKHRLLLVTRPHFTQLRLGVTIDEHTQTVTVSNHPAWTPLKFGTEPLRFRFVVPHDATKPKTEVAVKAEPVVGVVFQQTGLRCDGWRVSVTVNEMIADVNSIVGKFERFF
jgi:hypothetical protein